jgi:hypothetical protein
MVSQLRKKKVQKKNYPFMFIYHSSAIGFLILNQGKRGCKTALYNVHYQFLDKRVSNY